MLKLKTCPKSKLQCPHMQEHTHKDSGKLIEILISDMRILVHGRLCKSQLPSSPLAAKKREENNKKTKTGSQQFEDGSGSAPLWLWLCLALMMKNDSG